MITLCVKHLCGWLLLLFLVTGAGADVRVHAADTDEMAVEAPVVPMHKRRVETHIRGNRDRQVLMTDVWHPFYQEQDRVLYGDIRAMGDNQDNFEGNIGAGYRQIVGDAIYGGYGYVDRRRTALGSDIWQITVGGEYIREDFEFRANAYLPTRSRTNYQIDDGSGPYVAGNGIYVRGPTELVEEAQRGFDAEVGFHLPVFEKYIHDVRVYGGGYYFSGAVSPTVAGIRSRLEVDVTSWLQIGARAQHDGERGDQYFAELTLRFPGLNGSRDRRLWSRLADTPERDVDVVTAASVVVGAPQPVLDAETGAPVRIIYVDNRAGGAGNGSFERPFGQLSDALVAAHERDIVYVFTGDGTAAGYDSGAQIATNHLTLWGQGEPLYFDGGRYTAPSRNAFDYNLYLLIPAGDHPLISNVDGNGIDIVSDGVTIRGVQVDAATGDGIYIGNGASGTTVHNVRVTGNDGTGIRVVQDGFDEMSFTARDSIISGNRGGGIASENLSGTALDIDLGQVDDYGFNDIFGNIGAQMNISTGGRPVRALGNFWGAAPRFDGVDVVLVDDDISLIAPLCLECLPVLGNFDVSDNIGIGATVQSNAVIVGEGLRGHRYVSADGENGASLVVNGVDTQAGYARISAGDRIAMTTTADTQGLSQNDVTLDAAGVERTWLVRTGFVPNLLEGLVGWWDAKDIDGDFLYDDQPVAGSLIGVLADKTGLGHDAVASGAWRPAYDGDAIVTDGIDDQMTVGHTLTLAALGSGMSVGFVMSSVKGGDDTALFRYGSCGLMATSRCAQVGVEGDSGLLSLRLDTQAARAQEFSGPQLFDGEMHTVWVDIGGDGQISWTLDGQSAGSGTYTPGSGFLSTTGIQLMAGGAATYHELFLFSGVLDGADRALVDSYLAARW